MLPSIFLFFSILFVSWFMVIFFPPLAVVLVCLYGHWPGFSEITTPFSCPLSFCLVGVVLFPGFFFILCLEVVTLVSRDLGFFFLFFGGGFFYIFLERLVVGVGVGVLREITCK